MTLSDDATARPHHSKWSHRAGLLGAMLAVATLPAHLLLPLHTSQELAAVMLALIAAIYVGFALSDGRVRIVAIEVSVALGFAVAVLVGLWVTPWAVPAATALHGLWDLAHHRRVSTTMPRWYVPFCAVYDWIFASGLAAIWWLR